MRSPFPSPVVLRYCVFLLCTTSSFLHFSHPHRFFFQSQSFIYPYTSPSPCPLRRKYSVPSLSHRLDPDHRHSIISSVPISIAKPFIPLKPVHTSICNSLSTNHRLVHTKLVDYPTSSLIPDPNHHQCEIIEEMARKIRRTKQLQSYHNERAFKKGPTWAMERATSLPLDSSEERPTRSHPNSLSVSVI